MKDLTVQDIINGLPSAFVPANADGINADVQLHLTGGQGGDWVVSVKNKTCTVAQGTTADPRVNLTADAQDFVNLVMGRLNPMMAFMRGKLQVQGDMGLAARFPNLFRG